MRRRNSDYLTVAGFVALFIVLVAYCAIDYVDQAHSDLSLNIRFPEDSLPGFSLDWLFAMDTASQILMGFIVVVLIATFIGCIGIYFRYRNVVARK